MISKRRIFKGRVFADPFPVEHLKRVDKPTTVIHEDQVQRTAEQDHGFFRAARGDYGPRLQKEFGRFVQKHPLSGAQAWMMGNMIPLVDGPVAPDKAPLPEDPERISLHIKETAYFLRADLVGICALPQYAVYSEHVGMDFRKLALSDPQPVELNHKYAIALLIDQDWRTAEAFTGNDWISNAMSMLSYSTSGFIACILAQYIRRLGYPARAHYAANYQVVVPPILLMAGLGEVSRMSDTVVNPFLGPRFKAAVVTTDLPLVPDKPIDFGLQDFCAKCKKCARECPSGAITAGDKEMFNGYERWPMHVEKCVSMRVGNKKGAGCGTCLKVCPFNKPFTPFHRMVRWSVTNIPMLRRFAVWGDDLLGYGKPHPENQWWLDLEDVEGVLRIPSQFR